MPDIRLDGTQECICGGAVEEADLDRIAALEQGRPEPVHTVDDLHCSPVNEERRQGRLGLRQLHDMGLTLAV
jgi:hypothetical protein